MRMCSRRVVAAGLTFALLACVDSQTDVVDAGPAADAGTAPARQGPSQDIVTTDLDLDLAARTGRAKVVAWAEAGSGAIRLETAGLTLSRVAVEGVEVERSIDPDGVLVVKAPSVDHTTTVEVDYQFPARTVAQFDGWMPVHGVSFIWPYFCSHLFPCDSSLADGVVFRMNVTGVSAGKSAIYPRTTVGEGPSYLPGVAVGAFDRLDLGATAAGTKLSAWYDPSMVSKADAEAGTEHYVKVFDFFEKTYGPYTFGPESGSVSVDWGNDSFGGMEFHPFVHVARNDFGDEEVHAHEAAHAWFGDGVRMQCWEDFVVSEGTVTYMAARGLQQVGGPDAWGLYMSYLKDTCTGGDTNAIVLPDTCNEIDLLSNDLWSLATYMKGACFYEEVADTIGWASVDAVIADFYKARVGRTARMSEMIAALEAKAPEHRAEIERLATEWLKTLACPADYEQRCGTHRY